MSKRLKFKMLGFLVAVAIFCMVPFGRAEAAPGTTWKTAETVVMDKEYYSDVYSGKSDWYKVVLSKPGLLYVYFDGFISSANLAIYSSNISSCYFKENLTFEKYYDSYAYHYYGIYHLSSGTYYLKVSNAYSAGEYGVTFSFNENRETVRERQGGSNQTLATASKIGLYNVYYGLIGVDDSKDFYRFSVNQQTRLRVSAGADNLNFKFAIFNSKGKQVAEGNSAWKSDYESYYVTKGITLPKGTYYLLIKAKPGVKRRLWDFGEPWPDGEYYFALEPHIGWKTVNGKRYYLYQNGKKKTGWLDLGAKQYYFLSDGSQKTGWKTINYQKYYFDPKDGGAMSVGWKTIGGKRYYFYSGGQMATGWAYINGKSYYFLNDGSMKTGWKTINGKRYYFKTNGVMQTGWLSFGSKRYYMDEYGVMQTGWVSIGGKRYYFKSDGVLSK